MRLPISAALLLALAPACANSPVGPTICFVEDGEQPYVVEFPLGVEKAWTSSKSALLNLPHESYYFEPRKLTTWIDGSIVTVTLEALEPERSRIHISAARRGEADSETARMVTDRILSDLERKR